MSLYSKKLHVKKLNNQIQIANLYTDKNDVGSNYLTLNDNNNIVYAPLMNNGDIDCKINKNNQIFKVNSTANRKDGITIIKFIKRGTYGDETQYYPQTFTVPDNVHVVTLYFYSYKNGRSIFEGTNYSFSTNIKVTPNKTYTCQYSTKKSISGDKYMINNFKVTMQFSHLTFEAVYYDEQRAGNVFGHYTDAFALSWYANEPNYQYSAD